ncbi:E3 SUMO-protein ligase PIAS1-like [Bacillus rossius redtenbacheri]|uniref:E3 SUMO-protein ligase PIAS1-like n=1 Tax=Bacillus rossius redtenbacheri TaxID=93214 RepID=UPI002FDEAB20
MADIEKLKKMVLKLPLSDLQTILDYAGRRKVGKKRDLQARIIGLLHQPLAGRVKKKIKEVFDSVQWRDRRGQDSDEEDEDPDFGRPSRSKSNLAPFLGHQQSSWDDSINIYNAYNMLMDHQRKSRSPRAGLYPYPGYILDKPSFPASANNTLPNIELKKLPFYEHLAVLLEPTTLIPRNSRRLNEASFHFYLTPQQATDVISSFTIEQGFTKANYVTQVQLRFCRLETFDQHDDCFPPGVSMRVNGKLCTLPAAPPASTAGVEPRRPPRPVDLTPYLQASADAANRLDVSWNPLYGHVHVVTVSLVRKLTAQQLLERLRARGFREAEYTRGLIRAKMSGEGEIAATSLRLSLACPLGKTRMALPCRANTCSHLQCFDAAVFLSMNELRPTWLCPVCGQACPYDALQLDGYFHELLSSEALPAGVTEIQVDEQGAWSPYIKEDPQVSSSKPAEEFVLEEIAFDDIEVISMKPVSNKSKKPSRPEILVDLTNSDSDEETSSSSSDEETSRNSEEDRPLTELIKVKSQPSTSTEPVPGAGDSQGEWGVGRLQPRSSAASDSSVILIDLT